MKAVVLLFAVSAIMVSQMAAADEVLFDEVDIDVILQNDRLLNSYFECFVGKKYCTEEGVLFQEGLPEIISSGCAECTDRQKGRILKIVRYLKNNKPDMFKELSAIYDPTGEHLKKHLHKL